MVCRILLLLCLLSQSFCEITTSVLDPYDFEAHARRASLKAMEQKGVEGSLHRGVHSLKRFKDKWDSNSIKPKAFNFRIVRGDGYETALGYSLNKNWELGKRDSASVEARYLPYTLDEPYDKQRIHLLDLSVSRRRFLKPRLYAQAQVGVRHYKPNQAIRDFYSLRNSKFDSETIPYASIGVGYLLLRSLPVVHRPLVLAASYTVSDDYRYPSIHPLGHTEFDPAGFSVGLKVGFKF